MKLILIEDEPEALLGMRKAVESIDLEFALYTSNNGEEALSVILDQRPDLIVTDIMLPYITGLEIVEQVTSQEYQPKVIVVSGYNDFEYARRSIQVGAMDYLLKPFGTDDFTGKIRRAIESIQQENMLMQQMKQQQAFAEIGNRSMRDAYLTDFCLRRTSLEEHLYQRLCLWELEWLANGALTLIVLDTKGYPDGKPLGREFSLQTFAIGNVVQELLHDHAASVLFKDPQNRWVILTADEDIEGLSTSIVTGINQYQKIPIALGASPERCRSRIFMPPTTSL
ncbi:response regulator [Paenibacillus xerothermodurans]|uniref:Response regulator n=1 Tax=Paenibacillus xerothermodurans TaxID=1977292 RepID=A0A2W1NTK2_PAEXE|nr:response regulator [Paenibacillus xerothermodurans]PZE21076.1 response regulator [Paenibacillus xerothermodurans]